MQSRLYATLIHDAKIRSFFDNSKFSSSEFKKIALSLMSRESQGSVLPIILINRTEPLNQQKSSNYDNMRGFDPASEDDMDDNGMSRYMENDDEEGWD